MPAVLLYSPAAPPPLTRLSSGDNLRRLHGGVRASGKNPFLFPSTMDRVASFQSRPSISTKKHQFFSKMGLNCSNSDKFLAYNSREDHNLEFDVKFPRHFYLPNLQELAKSKIGKACILGNLIMLVVPSFALAEGCEPDNSFYNMPILFGIAMIGATVGGLLARQRRGELTRLNDQLRQINAALRRQAKIESYAPTLSYAPVGSSKLSESELIVDPRKEQLLKYLRAGKNHLRNQNHDSAFTEFKAALELARDLEDHVEEKKAVRGLGASLQRQGKYKEAIKYHTMVLNISKRTGEDSGITEAYGAIADCYTELGELEKAGKFYDKYIARLEND